MSFSLSKLRSFLPGQGSAHDAGKRHSVSLEPEVGFQLTLEPQSSTAGGSAIGSDRNNIPELNVHLIAARHLPSMFGLKTVQGYVIKVKLFPGAKKYDSTIQTCSWPKYNENFKFPLGPEIKPSLKNYSKEKNLNENLPEKCFAGHFVVFTVYALLELPPGGTYRSLRDKGVSLLKTKAEASKKSKDDTKEKPEDVGIHLTKSESRRNIGSVTCYLEPKIFKKSSKGPQFLTEEIWLPIKDITVTPSKNHTVTSSPKGQIELILEVHDSSKEEADLAENGKDGVEGRPTTKRQWSLTEMKKKIKTGKPSKSTKDLCLKVTTSKMRCSIKVKDEFEATAGLIYVKTTVFEHNILSNSWKSDNFQPSLSTRWEPEQSTIEIPIDDERTLQDLSIKTTVATKNKMGKKIVLGTVLIGPTASGQPLDHWQSTTATRNEPVAMYHNFI